MAVKKPLCLYNGLKRELQAGDTLAGVGNPIGSIIRAASAPDGYLYCDGSLLDAATYADLFAAVGYSFSPYENKYTNGQPWRQQFYINTAQSADVTDWTTATSLPGALAQSQAIVTNSRVYLLGGNNGSATATVYTAPINSDGTLGTWTTDTALPVALSGSQAIVTNSRVYLIGDAVYTAPINSDGTLGAWTTGTALPWALSGSQAIVTNSRVYLLGGWNGNNYVSTVYTAPINSDGTLGAWAAGTALPEALYKSHAIVTNSRVYLMGGWNGSNYVSTVYTAPINSGGTLGAWTTGTALPAMSCDAQVIVTNSRVYLMGGNYGSTVATVYTAPIKPDGTLGIWAIGTALPGAFDQSQAIVTNSRVYLLGGHNNGSGCVSTVYTAAFSGGLNSCLDKTFIPSTPPSGQFMIPDLRHEEVANYGRIKSYIKY